MKKHDFQVRPIAHYDGARYLSAYGRAAGETAAAPVAETAEAAPRSWTEILQSVAMLALVLMLSVTMVACFDRQDDDGHQEQWTSDGGSGDGGNDQDGGDITMGVMVECNPGDIYCSDETTLQTCTDSYWYETTDCNDWCQQEYGTDYGTAWSNGCNTDAPEPCQCEWDMIDGGMPYYCAPEEVYCVDESTVQLCDGAGSLVTQDCNAYCQSQDPNGYAWSAGCNAGAEDPCQCQYDIVDGDIAACTPGDIFCSDANTANVCSDDQWSYTSHDCTTYCTDTYGPQYSSSGCDATAPENFCGCVLYVSP